MAAGLGDISGEERLLSLGIWGDFLSRLSGIIPLSWVGLGRSSLSSLSSVTALSIFTSFSRLALLFASLHFWILLNYSNFLVMFLLDASSVRISSSFSCLDIWIDLSGSWGRYGLKLSKWSLALDWTGLLFRFSWFYFPNFASFLILRGDCFGSPGVSLKLSI